MGKSKKKSFWGEASINDDSQIASMERMLRITAAIESGETISEMDLPDDPNDPDALMKGFNSGIDDAFERLMAKNGTPVEKREFQESLLTRVESTQRPPVTERVDTEDTSEERIRDMEPVEQKVAQKEFQIDITDDMTGEVLEDEDKPAEESEDEEAEESDDEEEDKRPLTFADYDIMDGYDDWLIIRNAYDFEHVVRISAFNMRGYEVARDANYELMCKYIPIMIALLAGPALIVRQDNPIFMKFMRSAVDARKKLDKNKFMAFSSESTYDKVYIIYLLDAKSRNTLMDDTLPILQKGNEETDFFCNLATTVLNPMINPYGMLETNWPTDRASQCIDTDEKIEEFCNMMAEELEFTLIDKSKLSYASAIESFRKNSVIGDLQNFLKTIEVARTELEKQMIPQNYREAFLDQNDDDSDAIVENAPVEEPTKEPASDDLFDNVGEDVPEENVSTSNKPEKPQKPAKLGADGKKAQKKYEIPVQSQ